MGHNKGKSYIYMIQAQVLGLYPTKVSLVLKTMEVLTSGVWDVTLFTIHL